MKYLRLGLTAFLCLLLLQQAQAACHLTSKIGPTRLLAPSANELLVATQNLWLFHDANRDFRYDKAVPERQVTARVQAIAQYIVKRLSSPHILALQEVENRQLLESLTGAIKAEGGPDYQIYIKPNQDVAGNTVALLTRSPVKVATAKGMFKGMTIPGHGRSHLFSRPPLLVTITRPLAMEIMVVHLRSAYGIHKSGKRHYVVAKRSGQTKALIRWKRQQKGNYIVLGDFNTGPGDGDFSNSWKMLKRAGWREAKPHGVTAPWSYIHQCKKEQLDHVYLSKGLFPLLQKTEFAHGNAGHYRQLHASHGVKVVSDHDGLGVYLRIPDTATK